MFKITDQRLRIYIRLSDKILATLPQNFPLAKVEGLVWFHFLINLIVMDYFPYWTERPPPKSSKFALNLF